jgi:group I intron endonuclease
MFGQIYCITNLLSGKKYIGQTTQPLWKRWSQHCNVNSRSMVIGKAIQKYGKENFIMELVYKAETLEELNLKETEYIKEFNTLSPNGYNLGTGGGNRKLSDETKRKLSLAHIGKKLPPMSLEVRKKISAARIGIKFTSKHLANMKLHMPRGGDSYNAKPVICLETGQKFVTITEAARVFNMTKATLSCAILEKRSAKGYTFQVLEDIKD